MIRLIPGSTADDVWRSAIGALSAPGSSATQSSRGGATRELLHTAFSLDDPRQRWIPSREPPVNPAFGLVEAFWILCGRNDSALPVYYCRNLPQYQGEGDRFYGAYGHRLRRARSVDQIQRAFEALRSAPDTRQVVLQIWDGDLDLPRSDGTARSPDIPCNVMSLLKIRDGRLEWTQVMRSNDAFRGLPQNFVQFTTLQEVMAGWLEVDLGSYNHFSDSLHAYENDMHEFRVAGLEPVRNTDTLALPKEQFDHVIADIERLLDRFISADLQPAELKELMLTPLPEGYRNAVLIVAAETARRRGWTTFVDESVGRCTNPLLVQLWSRWFDRVSRGRQKVREFPEA